MLLHNKMAMLPVAGVLQTISAFKKWLLHFQESCKQCGIASFFLKNTVQQVIFLRGNKSSKLITSYFISAK